MKISEIRIDGQVMTKTGRIGRVTAACNDGRVYVLSGGDYPDQLWASDIEPVSDPCQSCEMAATINRQCQKIAELQTALDVMTIKSNSAHRNARYWREELEKLQQEALSDSKPIYDIEREGLKWNPKKIRNS